eukprot:jgi/Psemu1/6338/gm1.6338_g
MTLDEAKRRRRRKRDHVPKSSETTAKIQEASEPEVDVSKSVHHNISSLNENDSVGGPTPEILFRSTDETSRNHEVRRSLPKEIANEIKQSFIIRRTKKLRERRNLISQVRERRELKQNLRRNVSKSNDASENQHTATVKSTKDYNDNRVFKTQGSIQQKEANISSPETNEDERNERQQNIEEMNDNEIQQNVGETPSNMVEKECNVSSPKTNKGKRSEQPRILGENTTNFGTRNKTNDELLFCRTECARLKREKKALKTKLVTRDAQSSLLRQEVNDLTSEIKTLQKQLSKWQKKSHELFEMHSKERIKFDNSTDLIAQAKIGLTKALNDASNLEAKIDDLEAIVDDRERRIDDLYETIERQTQNIDETNMKLKDKDTLLRLTENEKRILEDEIEVLIASKDKKETGEALRRLEREREKWLQEQEARIDAARIQLGNDIDKNLEREKNRHRQEQAMLIEFSSKKKENDEKQQKMQDFVNQQLDDMMDVNRELQRKLTKEREDLLSKRENQDNMIQSLELLVIDLRNQLATRNRFEKELMFRKAEVESMREELLDAREQNKLLKVNELEIHRDQSKSHLKTKEKPVKKSQKKTTKSSDRLVTSNVKTRKLKTKQKKKNKKETPKGPSKSEKKTKAKKKKSVKKKATIKAVKKATIMKKRKKKSKQMKRSKSITEAFPDSLAVTEHKSMQRTSKIDELMLS